MLQLFSNLKKFIHSSRRSTESFVFYLHYRVTFLILVSCCILTSTQQLTGNRIACLSKPNGEINVDVLNSYCWAASTYSVSSAYLKEVGVQVPHPGIQSTEQKSEYEYRNFYQYVHIVIFIQAVLFYIPHVMWKSMEKKLFSTFEMIKSFNEASTSVDKKSGESSCESSGESSGESSNEKIDALSKHIEDRWGSHKSLVLKYLCCELLSTINVLIQSYLLDIFFRGKFISMGLFFEAYYKSEFPSDPIRLFPVVTICSFHRYGPSGFIDIIDSLCVLSFNAINAKIYLFQWIWFIILLLLSFLNLLHLLACIILPIYRRFLSKLLTHNKRNSKNTYMQLIAFGDFGDWFLMSAVKKNMDDFNFYSLAENLLAKLRSLEKESKQP